MIRKTCNLMRYCTYMMHICWVCSPVCLSIRSHMEIASRWWWWFRASVNMELERISIFYMDAMTSFFCMHIACVLHVRYVIVVSYLTLHRCALHRPRSYHTAFLVYLVNIYMCGMKMVSLRCIYMVIIFNVHYLHNEML